MIITIIIIISSSSSSSSITIPFSEVSCTITIIQYFWIYVYDRLLLVPPYHSVKYHVLLLSFSITNLCVWLLTISTTISFSEVSCTITITQCRESVCMIAYYQYHHIIQRRPSVPRRPAPAAAPPSSERRTGLREQQ